MIEVHAYNGEERFSCLQHGMRYRSVYSPVVFALASTYLDLCIFISYFMCISHGPNLASKYS